MPGWEGQGQPVCDLRFRPPCLGPLDQGWDRRRVPLPRGHCGPAHCHPGAALLPRPHGQGGHPRGPGGARPCRPHNSPPPAASPGLRPGAGREQLPASLSPGRGAQHAAPLGFPDWGLPVPVPEPCPHNQLPQVGEGPPRGAGASPGDTDHLAHVHSFSGSGALLCGVGKDPHGRTVKGRPGGGPRAHHLGRHLFPEAFCRPAPQLLAPPHPAPQCPVCYALWMESTFQ